MKKIHVAVIGVGLMGLHHARNFYELEDVELVAVCDVDKKRGKQVSGKFNCVYYENYHDLFRDEKIELVSVVVPTSLHFKVVRDCLKARINVFVEKPICGKSQEARKLIKIARDEKLILAVGHVERFNPAVKELKRLLSGGEVGKIVSLSAKRVGLYPPRILDTNLIIDLAIHDLDIFSFLLDKTPTKFYCLGGKALTKKRIDYAKILLSYAGSVHGIIQVNWITPVKIRKLTVTGTKGYMELDYINQKLKIYRSRYIRKFESFGEFLVKFGRPDVIDISVAGEEPLRAELVSVIDSVRFNREPEVDGKVGLEALIIAEKVLMTLK